MTWTRQARGRLGLVLWACRGPDVFMCDHSFNPETTLSLRVSHQEVVFAPRVIGSVWRHLLVVTPGTWGVEARDTATHPAVRRPAPAAENSWALDISGAKVASLGLYTHVCVCVFVCVHARAYTHVSAYLPAWLVHQALNQCISPPLAFSTLVIKFFSGV